MSATPNPSPGAILIVDDDTRILKFLSQLLTLSGFPRHFAAASIPAALDIWQKHQSEIWLVITDFVMPEDTGDSLALQFLFDKPAVKILFISGNDPLNLDSKIPLQPRKNFLQKPFTMADLRTMIQSALPPAPPVRTILSQAPANPSSQPGRVIQFPQVP